MSSSKGKRALLEEYRSKELSRVDKKLSWLTFQLEQFMRSTSEKTIDSRMERSSFARDGIGS